MIEVKSNQQKRTLSFKQVIYKKTDRITWNESCNKNVKYVN